MVSVWSMAAMVVSLLICVLVPLVGILLVRRRARGVWVPFWCGALAFFVSQMLTRIPLMTMVVPGLPEPIRGFLLSLPVASFTAGLFEETGRLVVMLLLMKTLHRLADGVAFGLGHGGLEAVLIVGLGVVNNLVVATMINSGQWATIAQALPPATAEKLHAALVDTPSWTFLLAGAERVWAIGLHIACSILVLAGIVHGRKLLFWLAAVLLHGLTNLTAAGALASGVPMLAVEAGGFVLIAVVLWLVVLRVGRTLPRERAVVLPAGGVPPVA